MNINSTEEERYEELKDKIIKIIPWKETNINLPNTPNATRGFVKDLGLTDKSIKMQGFDFDVIFNKNSVNESINRNKGRYEELNKLFTVIDDVCGNAICLQIEKYNHPEREKAKEIKQMHQFVSAFCDDKKIYPVKITVEERNIKDTAYLYMIITVRSIDKKEVPDIRVHPSKDGESVPNPASSFDISLSRFVQYFNEKTGILLKHFPNQFLTEEQVSIKDKTILHDKQQYEERLQLSIEKKALKQADMELKKKIQKIDFEEEWER